MASIYVEKSGGERYQLCMSKSELTTLHKIMSQVQGPKIELHQVLDQFFEEERQTKERNAQEKAREKEMEEARRQFFRDMKSKSTQSKT